ncbi:hypothetical protein [Frondihabitans peucedani]|uniref:TIGR04255 family protein n=1 Tax=Frondihabitans peucedani TaxID=598626 RepID=A0ABP8E1D1_9MICO
MGQIQSDNRAVALEGATVNFRGVFAPRQFTPEWFRDQELISSADFDRAEIDGVTPDLTVLRLAWLTVTVTAENMVLTSTSVDDFPLLRDVALGVLNAVITPLTALGINREYHVQMEDIDEFNLVGDVLAPKALWNDVLKESGMKDVTLWGQRQDHYGGRVHVTVQPSAQVKLGVYFLINDHFDLTVVEHQPAIRITETSEVEDSGTSLKKHAFALEVLATAWESSFAQAESIRTHVIAEVLS